MKNIRLFHFLAFFALLWSQPGITANPQVRMSTNLGDIDIELYAEQAPATVANFLSYVDSKYYNGTIFHRVIDGFMIQGGGFDQDFKKKTTAQPIRNEAYNGLKNEIGTLAMARTGDPHSATAQFFINVNNNSPLDFQIRPYGPLNTLRQSQLGIQDSVSQRIATTSCRGLPIQRSTLEKAKSAKPGDLNHYECLMQAILGDPEYRIERELTQCLSQAEQLKQSGKLGKDETCSSYLDKRHQALKLVHVYWGYAVFGRVIQGMEVVDKIKSLETGPGGPFRRDAPKETVIIQSVDRIQQELQP